MVTIIHVSVLAPVDHPKVVKASLHGYSGLQVCTLLPALDDALPRACRSFPAERVKKMSGTICGGFLRFRSRLAQKITVV